DVMVAGSQTPMVNADASLKDALLAMSSGQLGFLVITNHSNELAGVFSDGDLRRALDRGIDINHTSIADVMTPGGHCVEATQPAVKALELMEKHKIYALPVIDAQHKVCGALNMHSLFQAGVVQV
ncbi:MAG: CBS domain-containing protein, partial [Pseudomonadota bacterium]